MLIGSGVSRASDIAQDIARIHLEAMGGEERLARLESFRTAGVSRVGDFEMSFQMWAARPNLLRIEMTTGPQTLIQGWDGEGEPWVQTGLSQPPQRMAPELKERFTSEADFDDPLFRPAERGYVLEYAGEGEVDGRPAVKLLATRDLTDQSTLYLAADTYFIVRQDRRRPALDGTMIETQTFYGDFRPVMGVILPHGIVVKEGERIMSEVALTWMEPNPPIDEGWFSPPTQAAPHKE